MARSIDEIMLSYYDRKAQSDPLLKAAREVTDAYNGDLAVPLPELDRDEKRAVPNLLAQGLNQLAMRVSSTVPDVFFPPEKPGQRTSEQAARIRRQATLGWWEHSNIKLLLGRRSRHLLGYASSPVLIRPDFKSGVPGWQIRNPLRCYPAATTNPDDVDPSDVIFTHARTLAWLQINYPAEYQVLSKGQHPQPDQFIELVEYVDHEQTTLIAVGEPADPNRPSNGSLTYVELGKTVPNRAGICPAVVPGRITLDRRMGAFDGMIGLYQRQAKLMALEVIAVERGIFSDEWLVARPGETPSIVQMADGRRGVLGILRGGEIHETQQNPGYKTDSTIAGLERAQRLEAGIPAEFGGESTTNVRTGRRGDSILSAVVDFPVQEAQRIFEVSMEQENRVAIAIAKAYFGKQPKSFYVSLKGGRGTVDYTPNKHFTSDANSVSYAHAGADVNNLTIGIGQMVGIDLMSLQTGREMHPFIDDPEKERERIIAESLEKTTLLTLEQAAQSGQLAPNDAGAIANLVVTGKEDLYQAIDTIHKAAQARQATSGAAGTPEGPVVPGAPEAQPGIGAPDSSAPAGTIGPTANEQGLAQLVGALRGAAAGA